MYLMTVLANFFMICVPLFLMLSGYLQCTKKLSTRYYLKLIHLYFIYVLASLCCMLYLDYVQGNSFSLFVAIFGTTAFDNAPYSWYFEMYIGLFLMIPFLNLSYNGLTGKRQKQLLVLTFLILTALPPVANIFRFGDSAWWITPSISSHYRKLLPSWWVSIYPLTYYFLGCYFREFPPKLNTGFNALLLVLSAFLAGGFTFYRSHGGEWIDGDWFTYQALPVLISTVLAFVFFLNLNYDRLPRAIYWAIRKISDLSFGTFLVSWIFDEMFYSILNQKVPVMQERIFWFPVIVPAVLLCSTALSAVLEGIAGITITPLLNYIQKRLHLDRNIPLS